MALMRTRLVIAMLLGVSALLAACYSVPDSDPPGCREGYGSGSATIEGTPTGSLPSSGSYTCANLNPVGSRFQVLFENRASSDDEYQLYLYIPAGAGTAVIDTANAFSTIVAFGDGVTGGSTSTCLLPTGSLTSDGTITVTTAPTAETVAGSFSIPALCDTAGNPVFTGATGTFEVP